MTATKHPAGHVLQAFFDDELSPTDAAGVADHCRNCEHCQTELTDLEQMGRLLAGAAVPELPRTVWHRVRPGRAPETRFKPVFAFAACAVGIVLGVLLGPIQFSAEQTGTELAWSETATIWNTSSTSSLLNVYQVDQE